MKKEKIIFWTIIVIGILVRIWGWPNIISEINCDEGMTAINAYAIAETGKDIYGTSFPVYLEAWRVFGQSVFLMYMMAICIKIVGYSLLAVRLPMLIMSIACLFVFYDLCKRIFKNERIALIGLFMVAISPWHILQSIWSIDCNMFPHMLLISIWVLIIGREKKNILLYLSMLLFGITMYTYGEAIYVVPLLLLIFGIYLLKNKDISVKQFITCIVIYTIISLPIFTMFVLNGLGIDKNINIGIVTIQYFKYNVRTGDMLFFSDNIGATLIENIKALLKTVFIQYDNLEWNATLNYGTIYKISILFIIIALIKMIKIKKDEKRLPKEIFFLIIWLCISIILGIVINNVNINRLNVIWYPLILLTTYGISIVFEKKELIGNMILVLYSIIFIAFAIYLHKDYKNVISMSGCFSRGYLSAIKYADSLNKEKLIYSNMKHDGTREVYIKFQTAIDKKSFREISDEYELINAINNLKDSQVLLLEQSEYEKNNISQINYKIQKFNEYVVIYK